MYQVRQHCRLCRAQNTEPATARSFPATLGFGAGLAILNGVFDYTGGAIQGRGLGPNNEEDYGSKEWMRRNRRRPIQETLDELGEGRGNSQLRSEVEAVGIDQAYRDIRARI